MRDDVLSEEPTVLAAIRCDTEAAGFGMASESRTGGLLRVLAASKPGGRLLELGTGTGAGTAWLLDGMDSTGRLETVDNDEATQAVARCHLGRDVRVRFHLAEGSLWLRAWAGPPFDLIFADAWPGKYTDLDLALGLLAAGGLYVVDDLLPQPNWSAEHAGRVEPLLAKLEHRTDLVCVRLAWASGLAVVARRAELSAADRPGH
jgi:predicted O-methyltransferase YrrM